MPVFVSRRLAVLPLDGAGQPVSLVAPAAGDADRRARAALRPPARDLRQRDAERLAAGAGRSPTDDPTLGPVLDEKGVERREEIRERDCIPPACDRYLELDLARLGCTASG
jgi:hypothetical protein